MLSIRTQDRMALVPYNGTIQIFKDKVLNLKEVVEVNKFNLRLHGEILAKFNIGMFERLTPKAQKEYDKRKKPDVKRVLGHEITLNEVTLGIYKTKERCLEILDEICITVSMMNGEPAVYQMPKE